MCTVFDTARMLDSAQNRPAGALATILTDKYQIGEPNAQMFQSTESFDSYDCTVVYNVFT